MDSCLSTVNILLAQLKIRSTKQYLEDCIQSHPEYPSLSCISDTLEKYNIKTLPVKVDGEKLKELPLPCIVQLSDNGGMFHVLGSFPQNGATYLDDKGKSVNLPADDFLKKNYSHCLNLNNSHS